ncbi:hypothetical protein HYH03_002042 [Edaphochlamys debaryana]|uniref:Sfi1 spindle body domain-containing protein n=1 Tax=Edaphochlamys debaryana TaxID=47281 RepID=A0A835YCK9_9CHLO|nr:hypothetical protein HYH03_002042 [Edaphochlamys debaryana]|eukprot:KAG2500477.1 hypothetical protein HYH03_002042 [Edaphochlamys debaryana]
MSGEPSETVGEVPAEVAQHGDLPLAESPDPAHDQPGPSDDQLQYESELTEPELSLQLPLPPAGEAGTRYPSVFPVADGPPSVDADVLRSGAAGSSFNAYPSIGQQSVEFASSRNSPDMPGASSMYVTHHRWDAVAGESVAVHSPGSEHSYHSSVYVGASQRTSMAGTAEPRALVRSSEGKQGLATGDVVMFMQQGRPFIALQQRLPYKEDAVHTCLVQAPEDMPPESEGLAFLEVLAQNSPVGAFFGFRSGAAGNRFLQPRRKAPHRLVFFNPNCGVWEQWEPLTDAWATGPWTRLHMEFQSRRLPQVRLSVEVVRVGHYQSLGAGLGLPGATVGPSFAPTPRTLPVISEEGNMEDQNLRRISNVLVLEWFKFVDHEKVLREGLEADLAALLEETQELKLNTINQVEFLRVHMNEELALLAHHVASRDALIAALRAWLRRTQQLAADAMARARHRRILMGWRLVVDQIVFHKAAILKTRRKHARELAACAFWAWLGRARGMAGAASRIVVAVQRRAHMVMTRVLQGWQQVLTTRVRAERALLSYAARRAARILSGSFAAWRIHAAQRALGRSALHKALAAVRQGWLAVALTAWRGAVLAARRVEVQADLLAARRLSRLAVSAFAGWRSAAHARVTLRSVLADFSCTSRLRSFFTNWRSAASASHRLRNAGAAVALAWGSMSRRQVLEAWFRWASAQRSLRALLAKHVVHRSSSLLAAALGGWLHVVREARRRRALLRRHLEAAGLSRSALVLAGWRAVAVHTAWRRMSAALLWWQAYASTRAATRGRQALAQGRVQRMRLGSAFGAWHGVAARLAEGRRRMATVARHMLADSLYAAFTAWRLLARSSHAHRSAVALALPSRTRALLLKLLALWWVRSCAASAAGSRLSLDPPAAAGAAGSRHGGRPSPSQMAAEQRTATLSQRTGAPVVQPMGPLTASTMPVKNVRPQPQPQTAFPLEPSPAPAAGYAEAAASDASASFGLARSAHSPQRPPLAPAPPSGVATLGSPTTSPRGGASIRSGAGTPGRDRPLSSSGYAMPSYNPADTSHTTNTLIFGTPTRATGRSPARGSPSPGRSYAEALATSSGTAVALAALAGAGSPSHGVLYRPGGSGPGSRSSSTGRMRPMRVSASGAASSSPFVPANAAIIGAGGSPMLVEMAPGRGGEGPLTPIGLPELLDGEDGTDDVFGGGALILSARSPRSQALVDAAAWPAGPEAGTEQEFACTASVSSGVGRWLARAVLRAWHAQAAAAAAWRGMAQEVVAEARGRRTAAVFAAWRGAVSTSQQLTQAAEELGLWAVLRSDRQNLEEVLVGWHLVARRRAAAKALVRRHLARSAEAALRLTLLEWGSWAAGRKAQKRKVLRLVSRHQQSFLARAFAAWVDVTAEGAGRRQAAGHLANRRRHDVLSTALRTWCVAAAERRARAGRHARAAKHAQRRALAGAFSRWRWAAEAAAEREVAAEKARRCNALRTAFSGWLHMASSSPRSFGGLPPRGWVDPDAAMGRAATWRERRLLRGCLAALAEHAEDRRVLARQAEAIRRRAEEASAAAVLAHWRAEAESARRAGVEVVKMRARATRRQLSRCFFAWLDVSDLARATHAAADAMAARATRALLSDVFVEWRAEARRHAVLRFWSRGYANRINRGRLARAFVAWHEAAAALRARNRRTLAAARRIEGVLLRHVLLAWSATASRCRTLRLRVSAHLASKTRALLSVAFAAWLSHAQRLRAARGVALARASAADRAVVADALLAWADLALRAAAGRRTATARGATRDLGLLRAAFCGWADALPRLKAAREVAVARGTAVDRATLQMALEGWVEQAHRGRVLRAAAEALRSRREAARLPAALRAWAALAVGNGARRLQRAALAHLVLRRCMGLLRRAFEAWCVALAERRARDDELRRCIKRKKLAFGLFKQWYWEAFDADVQATIRRMFHSTDPAAHSPQPSRFRLADVGPLPPYAGPSVGMAGVGTGMGGGMGAYPAVGQSYQLGGAWRGGPVGGIGSYGGRAAGLPPLEPPQDLSAAGAAAGLRHRLLTVQAQRGVVEAGHQQPVRTLAPAFEALAAAGANIAAQRAKAAAGAASSAKVAGAVAGMHPAPASGAAAGMRSAAAAAAAEGRGAGARTSVAGSSKAVTALMLSDSDEEQEGPAAAAGAVPAGAGARRFEAAASFGAWAGAPGGGAGRAKAPALQAQAQAPAAVSSKRAVQSVGATAATVGARAVTTASAPGGGAAAATRRAAAAASASATASSLEAVTAMNAVLVNVANQLTEVSKTSLEIAAGVVAGSGGASAGRARSPSAGARPPPEAPLSPMVPPPSSSPLMALYGNPGPSRRTGGSTGSSGAQLPGVVPTWRQVATNQLYESVVEEQYEYDDGGLGPVNPSYVGITGGHVAGGDESGADEDEEASRSRSQTEEEEEEQEGEQGEDDVSCRMLAAGAVAQAAGAFARTHVGGGVEAGHGLTDVYGVRMAYENVVYDEEEYEEGVVEGEDEDI